MPGGSEPRLFAAVLADESTRANMDPEAAQAREHEAEDRTAAQARMNASSPPRPGIVHRLARYFGLRGS